MRFIVALWLALCAFCAPAHAVFVKVQGAANFTFSGTSLTVTFGSNITAGNAIIIAVLMFPNTISVTTATGNSNTFVVGACNAANAGGGKMQYIYALNATAGATTVTVNLSAATAQTNVWAEEWSGVATSAASDQCNALYTAGSGTAGNAFNTGAFTTTANGDLIWAFSEGSQGGGQNPGSGFTAATTDVAGGFLSEFQTQGTAGSITPGFTSINGCFDCYALGAGFKAAAGGGPTVSTRRSLTGVGP